MSCFVLHKALVVNGEGADVASSPAGVCPCAWHVASPMPGCTGLRGGGTLLGTLRSPSARETDREFTPEPSSDFTTHHGCYKEQDSNPALRVPHSLPTELPGPSSSSSKSPPAQGLCTRCPSSERHRGPPPQDLKAQQLTKLGHPPTQALS